MAEVGKNVAAGLESNQRTIGLTGLVPLAVLVQAPVSLRPEPGILRIHIELPTGDELKPGAPISYRIFGGEAGLVFPSNGQIVRLGEVRLPIELPYRPREYPEPPPRGQLSLDLSFWHRQGGTGWGVQDVQWRQPVVWDRRGGAKCIDLHFATAKS